MKPKHWITKKALKTYYEIEKESGELHPPNMSFERYIEQFNGIVIIDDE